MATFDIFAFSTANLTAGPGSDPIGTSQINGNPQVGGSYTVGSGSPVTLTIEDTDSGADEMVLEDGTDREQELTSEVTIGGTTYPVGTQVQAEFELVTDVLDGEGQPIRIIALRFDPPGASGLETTAYTTTAPIPPGTTFTVTSQDGTGNEDYANIICFAEGTLIRTPEGPRPIEMLAEGDLVATLDNGAQPVRWIGRRRVRTDRAGGPDLRPVRIAAGAMGNSRDLMVSPAHRVLVTGLRSHLLFGEDGVLAAARELVNDDTIRRADVDEVTYYHLMFDRHEIVWSEDLPSESFHLDRADDALSSEQAEELRRLFPERFAAGAAGETPARTGLRPAEATLL